MGVIEDRLKALGVQVGAKNIQPRPEKVDLYPIEKVIEGQNHPTIFGDAFITIRDFPHPYQHGVIDLSTIPDLKILSEWGKTTRLPQVSSREIAFLDTETSGLAGGTGTYAFLVGLGFHTDTSFRVVQFFMRDPSQEKALLAALIEWLTPFQIVVTFNGKSFDIPLLNTRLTLNSLTTPFTNFDHVDLLHLARRLWKDRLPSRALGALEKDIMGFHRDQDEVPGFLIPQYYFDYLASGDSRPLTGVFYHNALDIVSLAALFNFTASMLEAPQNNALPSLDLASIAKLYEELGYLEQAAIIFERSLAEGLPEEFFIKTLHRFSDLRRKQGDHELSVQLLEKAAGHADMDAMITLAKYYEHQVKDPAKALEWAQKAAELLKRPWIPEYYRRNFSPEVTKRIHRLQGKIHHLNASE